MKDRYELKICLGMFLYEKNLSATTITTVTPSFWPERNSVFGELKKSILAKKIEYHEVSKLLKAPETLYLYHKACNQNLFLEVLHIDDFIEIYIITETVEVAEEWRCH